MLLLLLYWDRVPWRFCTVLFWDRISVISPVCLAVCVSLVVSSWLQAMEYAPLVVEPRKPSFSSKLSLYRAPESRPEGCFIAPVPNSTGLPYQRPSWFPRSTLYKVSGESLSYPGAMAINVTPERRGGPIHLRPGEPFQRFTSAWGYTQLSSVGRAQLNGAEAGPLHQ